MSKDLIVFQDVWKTYKSGSIEFHALRGVSACIREGDFVAITGASGSGKSTMMNLVGCLDVPSKGRIFINGKDTTLMSEDELTGLRAKMVGFIFQQYNLIPTLSAFNNVLLPLQLQEYDDDEAVERVERLFDIVGLQDKKDNLPSQLSGGQQQRVSVARSLAANPKIILADEPTGALDSTNGTKVIEMLKLLWKEEKKTIVLVTHDPNLAKLANSQIRLKDGQVVEDSCKKVKIA